MTRLPTTHNLPLRPVSAALAELAIAGGMAGHPLALLFRDFAAPVLCDLWRHCTSPLVADQVYHVHTPADARKLANRAANVRLVLVHAARLHNPTAWSVQMSLPGFGQRASCPAIFTNAVPDEPDEDPGPTLILQANTDECEALVRWLALFRGLLVWPDVPNELNIGADLALRHVPGHGGLAGGFGIGHSREQEVLRGLLAGASLLRFVRGNAEPGADLTVTLNDYDHVRELLLSPVVSSASETCDPLAVAMVDRANVYLSVKYCPNRIAHDPFYAADFDSYIRGTSRRRDLVTRREIADLGNVRSRTIEKLVEYLRRQPDGHEQLLRMGFRRRPIAPEDLRRVSTKDLIARLKSWTPKQVRSHFDSLRKANLVTAEREHANGPWRYGLPEELSTVVSPFLSLPTREELIG